MDRIRLIHNTLKAIYIFASLGSFDVNAVVLAAGVQVMAIGDRVAGLTGFEIGVGIGRYRIIVEWKGILRGNMA
jgi:hypothetical protein